MPPADAKKLTESLAKRFAAAQLLAVNGIAQANATTPAPAATPTAAAATPPAKPKATPVRHAKRAPRKHAPASKQAAAKPDAGPTGASAAPGAATTPPAPKAG
jgi:hypothetical protein